MNLKCRKLERKSPGSSPVLSLHRGANPRPLVWAMWGLVFRDSFLSFPLITTTVIPFQGPQLAPWNFLGWFLEKEMATHSSILAWRIPGTEEPGGLPSMVSHRIGHD